MTLSDSLFRMLMEHGPLDTFEGSLIPTHYNSLGPSKSIDVETGILLSNFVEYYKPQMLVEIGVFRGYSTAWLLLGMALSGHPSHLHSFEVMNEGEYGRMWYDEFDLPKEHFTYHTIPGGIWKYPDQIPEKIDLLYIDDEHLPGPNGRYIELLFPRVPKGGIVLIDDMLNSLYKPMQQIYETYFMECREIWDFDILNLGHGLGVARKR